ncbi:hypothetical protein DL98DRAFT_515464 [Cadophora sp. DSE1049]|nr:hypothetical protein DL98DRAFT_515464 [Cadophora sp. DSE1049]
MERQRSRLLKAVAMSTWYVREKHRDNRDLECLATAGHLVPLLIVLTTFCSSFPWLNEWWNSIR